MDDLEFKCCPVKKYFTINIHEHEDVTKQRISNVAQNNEHETNELCYAHFNKKYFNELTRKSNTKPSAKHILLDKGF